MRTEQALCKRLYNLRRGATDLGTRLQNQPTGIYIDRKAVTTAMWVVKKKSNALTERCRKPQNGEACAATEVATMTKWIQSRGGAHRRTGNRPTIDALKLDYVPRMLERPVDPPGSRKNVDG